MAERTKKRWSYIAGRPGINWVRAYEEAKSGMLYLEWYEEVVPGEAPKRKRKSLGHRDAGRAENAADEMAAAFLNAEDIAAALPTREVTMRELFDRYLREETPHKGEGKQGHDRRAAQLWVQHLGRRFKAKDLKVSHWREFIRKRRSYELAPPQTLKKVQNRRERGEEVGEVGDRQIEYDLKFLWAVLNWAVEGDSHGTQLLERNPLRGQVKRRHWPKEENPSRPRLSNVQYERMLAVAAEVDWRFEVALILAHETGHRIGSIRQLNWSDKLAIDVLGWRKDSDKIGMAHDTPLTHPAVCALQKAREMNPEGEWVLPHPHPDHAGEPCSRHVMRTWWDEAQEKAGLGGVKRLGWHSLRRKFANDLRKVPLKDLAQLGGWKDVRTIILCYMGEDMDAMRAALASRRAYGGDYAGKKRGVGGRQSA